jgi:hypothetical protein
MVLLMTGCTYKEILIPSPVNFDCSLSTLAITMADETDATDCIHIDGTFSVAATGGSAPYQFSLDGGSFQPTASFSNLGPGYYIATVRDANLCQRSVTVEVKAPNTTLSASVSVVGDSKCLTDDGSVDITPSGGNAPYTFQFGDNTPTGLGSFPNLKYGYYTVILRDDMGCIKMINVMVPRLETGTSFVAVIKPILDTKCALPGCHNGDNGASVNWTVLSNVQAKAQNIKTRTGNHTMPLVGSLTQDQINLIACWVDDGAKDN